MYTEKLLVRTAGLVLFGLLPKAAIANELTCIAVGGSSDASVKVYVSPHQSASPNESSQVEKGFEAYLRSKYRQGTFSAQCNLPSISASYMNTVLANYNQGSPVVEGYVYNDNSTTSSNNYKAHSSDPDSLLRYISCVYVVDHQAPGWHDKFYLSGVFRARTSPALYWNNVYAGWKSYVEANYDTTGGSAITSHSCVEAASETLLEPKRRQMIVNASAGARDKVNVAYDSSRD